MADTIRRVIELDVKASPGAAEAVRAMQKELKALADAHAEAGTAAKKHGKDLEEAGGAFDKLNLKSVGFRRELLVLFHEMSQGNFKQFGGSVLVLGERMDATSLIMSAAGLAAIGLGAAVALVVTEVVKGALEFDKFSKSLIVTGNAAGVTADSVRATAAQIVVATGATAGAARTIVEQIVATGEFGPKLIEPLGQAIARLHTLTGQTTDSILKQFQGLEKGAVEFATEHNKQYHFISAAQLDYIQNLQDSGHAEESQLETLKLLTEHLGTLHVENLGFAERAWHKLGSAISEATEYIKSYGRAATIGEQVANAQAKVAALQVPSTPKVGERIDTFIESIGGGPSSNQIALKKMKDLAAAQDQLKDLLATQFGQTSQAIDKGIIAKVDAEGTAADTRLRALEATIRNGDRATLKIKEYLADIAAKRASFEIHNNPLNENDPKSIFNQGHIDNDIALLHKKYDQRPTRESKTDNAVDAIILQTQRENAALADQIRQYDELGKVVDKSNRVKLEESFIYDKTLKAATPAQKTTLRALKDKEDQEQAAIAERKSIAVSDDHIKKLQALVNVQADNTRELRVAIAVERDAPIGISKTSAAYITRADAIRVATNALIDQEYARKLAANEAATFDEVKKLKEETDLIGENSLQRQISVATLKLEAQARKEIASGGNAGDVNRSKDVQITAITAGLTNAYNATREFEAGAKTAFAKYAEDAANAGAFADQALSGGLKQVEDALFNLYKTGKLSIGSLWTFMSDEFLRQSAKMTTAAIFDPIKAQITDALKSLATKMNLFPSLKTNTPSVSTDSGISAVQPGAQAIEALASQQAATTAATTSLTVFGNATDTAFSSLTVLNNAFTLAPNSLTLLVSAANDAAFALQRVASSGGSSGGLGGLFSGSSGGAASSVGDAAMWFEASGGIVGPSGRIPLNSYAGGGIATGPQMTVFGEGRKNEAYIPLPDNKTVPVTLSGGGNSGGNTYISIENRNGSQITQTETKQPNGDKALKFIIDAAVNEVNKQITTGGTTAQALRSRGLNPSSNLARRF